jgi:O-antigen/teichoic acid export membrane protein
MRRSMNTSMWPACLIAIGGTLIAPMMLPLLYGSAFAAAVRPFQIVIWMIPIAWFSGHFRFSLIAAGHQRWEFAASAASAVVTVTASVVLVRYLGTAGAAIALVTGGSVNAVLALLAVRRTIGRVDILANVRVPMLTAVASLAVGLALAPIVGALASTSAACVIFVAVAARQNNDLVRLVYGWFGR